MTDLTSTAPRFGPRPTFGEVEAVQNPALGAYTIWLFALSYQHGAAEAPPLPLAFLVLPLLLHRPTLELISSTQKRSGLALLTAKLGEQRENLLAVHGRALALRRLTLQSIGIGTTSRLVALNYDRGTLHAYQAPLSVKLPGLPERLKPMASASDKLGHWFQQAGLPQVASVLRVDF